MDGRIPWVKLANMLLLWATLLATVSAGAVKWAEIVQSIGRVEKLEESVTNVRERQVQSQAEAVGRWDEVFRRLDRIERKIDRGPR